jgi:hypothetical protein
MKGITDGKDEWVAFRAVMTGFTETVSPSWDSSKFVGNPYNYYTYNGVERSANFTLKFYCMNVAELDVMWKKIDWLTKKAYPTITDVKLVNAPFIKLTLGSIYADRVGFINSLSYTIADDITWETTTNHWLPKVVDVQIEFKIVDWAGQETKLYNTVLSGEATKQINNKRQESGTPAVNLNPVTQPTPATSTQTTTGTTPSQATPSIKIDSKGIEQTTPPATTQTSKPKSLDTGKPAETPKQASDPATLTAIAMSSQTKFASDLEKAQKKYNGKGYPDWLVEVLSRNEASGTEISNITKIDENAYYMDKDYGDGPYEQVHYKKGNSVSLMSYEKWVATHDGNDPMNKFFKTNSSTSKLQTATPF